MPTAIREELGLKTGDRLTVTSDAGVIRILSRKMALESIRADIINQRGSLDEILDEFLAEKHEKARREEQDSELTDNQPEALHDE